VYTQCSKCETVFKLSAEVLRAAGGQVRCGRCGEVFNALARLAEDAGSFETGESALDLETRADSILESPPVPEAPRPDLEESDPPDGEIAHLEFIDSGEDPRVDRADVSLDTAVETAFEYTLPPGELDRIFIESKVRPLKVVPVAASSAAPQRSSSDAQPEPQAAAEPAPPPRLLPQPESSVSDRRVRNGLSGFEIPESVRHQMLAGIEDDAQSVRAASMVSGRDDDHRGARRAFIIWLSAAIAAALLLMLQVVVHQRDSLAAAAPFGSVLHSLLSSLGGSAAAPVNLSAYQLRQWGVTGDPAAKGTLRVRASILNTAAQLQPYPLLRVTLANRFGSRIGSRDFEPAEYLGKPTVRLLAPGERADATLDILDPGKNAEGFEIDVCLRQVDRKISCASDVALQTRK
jgi:predicted Zn finger-like uncharacterized protein